jgi:hypothetical protein
MAVHLILLKTPCCYLLRTTIIKCSNNKEEMRQTKFFVDMFSVLVKTGQNVTEPVSDIIYPIVETIDGVRTPDNSSGNKIVATVITSVYWREYLSLVLPKRSIGIVVVVDNPCNPSFTYQVKYVVWIQGTKISFAFVWLTNTFPMYPLVSTVDQTLYI